MKTNKRGTIMTTASAIPANQRYYTTPVAEFVRTASQAPSLRGVGQAFVKSHTDQFTASANTFRALLGRPTGNGPITTEGAFIEDLRRNGLGNATKNAFNGQINSFQNTFRSFTNPTAPTTADKGARRIIQIPASYFA